MQIQPNFESFFKTYLANKKLDAKSISKYLEFYNKYVDKYLEINQANIDSFLKDNTSSPAKATIKNLISALIRSDIPRELKAELVSLDILKQTGKKDKAIAKFIKRSDIDRLDVGIHDDNNPTKAERLKLMIGVQFYSALRVSELLGLSYNDLNKDGYKPEMKFQTITISSDSAKFGQERIAYLPTEFYVRLLKWVKVKASNSEYPFSKEEPIWKLEGKNIKQRRYSSLLSKWTEKVLGESYNTHSLRHGRATDLLLNEHMPIEIVKNFLGHSDIGSTQKYAHIKEEDVRNSLESLGSNNS